jgi:D-xylose transport system permease protein
VGKGIGVPVLVLVAVAVALTVVARRTRFGRHVFAYGGNPEAAFSVRPADAARGALALRADGALSAVAAVITTSRLNSGTHSIGQMAELYVDRGRDHRRHVAGGGVRHRFPAPSWARC